MKESSHVLFNKVEFGNRLTKLQVTHRYSNKIISLETGLTNYQALKSGKAIPSVLTLYKLSQFYDVTFDFLIHGKEFFREPFMKDNSLVEKAKILDSLNEQEKKIAMDIIDLLIYKQKYLELVKHKW
jgi:transcriptional regulator with XRE-family HTH domain